MTSIILEPNKFNLPLQTLLSKHDGEIKVRLGGNSNLARGFRRGHLEIIAEILVFCYRQKAKTSIMYKTNLNFTQLKTNLGFLTSQGFLTCDQNKYATTEKGYRFLDLFAQLSDLLNC